MRTSSRLRLCLMIAMVVLGLYPTAQADTTVGGIISADTTWTLANSPYVVTSTVQVYGTPTTPVTLTIEPGVVVKFNAGMALQIGFGTNKGSLVASGTTGSLITFTRNGTSGTWAGLTFYDGTVDATAVIEYADLQYSTGVVMYSASPVIRNSTITDVSGYGMNLNSSNPTLQNVTISSLNNYGMYLSASNPSMNDVVITANGSYGIYLASSSPTITGGSLTNTSSTGHGIYGGGSPVISNFTVSINNAAAYYGVYLTNTTSAFSLTNSTVGNGLYIGSTGILPTINDNIFSNADNSPIHAGANFVGQIMDSNTINGMTSAGKIEVVGETINHDIRWRRWSAPYVISGWLYVYKDATTAATFTIDPGVVLKFSSGMQIGSGTSKGALVAQGTSGERITFTRSGTSGNWSMMTFTDSTVDSTTILEYVDIQYSGGVSLTSASPTIRNSTITDVNGTGLTLSSSNSLIEAVTITNNGTYGISMTSSSPTITGGSLANSNSIGQGIYGTYGSPVVSNYTVSIANSALKYGVSLSSPSAFSLTNSVIANSLFLSGTITSATITGNTFTNADNSPIHVPASFVAQVMNSNTVSGMTSAGRIEVAADQIKQDSLWKKWQAPYVVSGTVSIYKDATTASTLTIESGTVLKFDAGGSINVGQSYGTGKGNLVAQGTSSDRITFTRSGTSGSWPGISFHDGSADGVVALEYADVQYSSGIAMNSASPVIRNSTFTDVNGIAFSLTTSSPILESLTITNNSYKSISLSTSSPTITGCSITNSSTSGNGIDGSGTPIITNSVVNITNTAGKYGVYLTSGTTSSLSIMNSTISNGLYIGVNNIAPAISGNTINGSDLAPIHAGANIIDQIFDNNTVTGMTSAGKIEVTGEQISRNVRWKKWPSPYWIISSITVYKDTSTAATLTIDPGAVLKFASNTRLTIGNGTSKGSLRAIGSASERIVFTRSGATGFWGGLTFNDGALDGSEQGGTLLDYVDIDSINGSISMSSCSPTVRNSTIFDQSSNALYLYASNPLLENVSVTANGTYGINLATASPIMTGGSLVNTSSTGQGIYGGGSPVISNYSVTIVNTTGKYGVNLSNTTSALSITNSTIGNGLYLTMTGILPTITGNTFTNGDNSPIHVGSNIVDQIMDNNTVTGLTAAGRIEVVGETVTRDVRWKKWAAPYVFPSGTPAVYRTDGTTAVLTIDPGTILKFYNNGLIIGGTGTSRGMLVAQGTESNKITFTSSQTTPAAGNWTGVTFRGSAASASAVENTIIEYGGSGAQYYQANVIFESYSAPVLRNCIIRNSAGSGVYMTSSSTWPFIVDSEITGNKWGIYSTGSNPTIMNSTITNNATKGIYNVSTTMDVDARGNWWGSATGPQHASNPSGTGNSVTDHVLFNPWLGQAPGAGFRFTESRTVPTSLNPDGDFIVFVSTITAAANWTITITDNAGAAIRTFTGSGATINQRWYGENDQAVKVADGAYNYRITAVNPSTGETALAPIGTIFVSRQIPVAILDVPADNQMFAGGSTINITGTASDSDYRYYTLEYGLGEIPQSWTTLQYQATTPVSSGLFSAWDTASLAGGIYTVRLTVTDWAGNIAIETSRVRLLWTQNSAASEAYISPNGDEIKPSTVVSATFTHPSTWTLTIKNASAETVKTFAGTGTGMAQIWDGKDEYLQVVSDGAYTYQIDAVSSETTVTAAPRTGTVTVDTVNPTALISSPTASAVLGNSVLITGTATDVNFSDYQLDYGPVSGAGPWSLLATATTSISSGAITTWIVNDQTNAVLVPNGSYLIRLRSLDKAGNSATSTVPVSVDNLLLSNMYVSNKTLDTQAGQLSTIFFTLNSQATVTLKIVPELQGPTGSPVYQATQFAPIAETYSFVWDGRNNAGTVVPDEAYLYILEASDGLRTDSYSPPAPAGTGTVNCSQSADFAPAKNIPLIITYTPAQPSRVNINILWARQDFRILDAAPAEAINTFVWTGWNPSNKLLDAGADASCSVASLLRENFLITRGDGVQITDLKTDPYTIHLSYGQFTRISYALSRDANVSISLRSPSGAVISLVSSEFQTAGSHELTWNGIDTGDTTGNGMVVSEGGDYIVSVQAVNPSTGANSTVKGTVRIGF